MNCVTKLFSGCPTYLPVVINLDLPEVDSVVAETQEGSAWVSGVALPSRAGQVRQHRRHPGELHKGDLHHGADRSLDLPGHGLASGNTSLLTSHCGFTSWLALMKVFLEVSDCVVFVVKPFLFVVTFFLPLTLQWTVVVSPVPPVVLEDDDDEPQV